MANARFSDEFLKAIPKTDLHLHLDGSLRVETLIDLARQHNVDLPDYTPEGLYEKVFKENYNSLEEYLECFKYTCAVLQTAAALERVSYELADDNFKEGVLYFEVRFAPQLHASPELDIVQVLTAVNKGLNRAKAEWNEKVSSDPEHPGYEYGIIVCGMRFFNEHFSKYFASFCHVHKNEKLDRVYGLASMALVTAAVDARDNHNIPVVGLDIAGAEDGFPAHHHQDAFQYAHQHFLCKTVHAGESYGPESIFQAVSFLHAERIGHGFHLFHDDEVRAAQVENPQEYVKSIVQWTAQHRVTFEVCLTSNRQTLPSMQKDLSTHPFRKMLDHRLSVCLCTDNRLVSRTSVTQEVRLAVDLFDMDAKTLRDTVICGFKRSFFPLDYPIKRAYVRKVINYYEKLEKMYSIDATVLRANSLGQQPASH